MARKLGAVLLFLAVLGTLAPRASAADWEPITDAEKNLKTNPLDPGAGAVVLFKRGEISVLERQSLNWTTHIVTYVRIKILTEAGRDAGNIAVEAPKYMRLAKVEGRTILPSGQIVPLDSSQVFHGVAYQSGKSFAILKTSFSMPSVEPGAILEYQTEEYADWFFPPPWIFDTDGVGTLESTLSVLIGQRLRMSQYPLETTQSKVAITRKNTVQGELFNFAVQNLRPIRREPFGVPFRDQAAMVIFTPYDLAFQNQVYPIITKWDDVAKEITERFQAMTKGAKEIKGKAKELTDKTSGERERAQAIYRYLQQNITSSNLAGVSLGREADGILNGKRGDPDEINALYVAMLKEAKVDADLVLVAAQNWQTLARQFPNLSQFSRVITRVNLKEGVVFADPADAAAPFGELPWFERGVTGLAVKGSKVQEAQIPAGVPEDNTSEVKVALTVARDWKAEGDAELDLKGSEAIDMRGDLLEDSPADLEKQIEEYFAFGRSDASVSGILHPDLHDASQPFTLKAHVGEKLTGDSGPGELLLNPWIDDDYLSPIFKGGERHSQVRFRNPEKRVSTSTWQLPPEIKVEQLPKEVKLDNDLGSFSHACAQEGTKVTCTRTFVLKKTLIQNLAEYGAVRKFFDEIGKDDQEVIVLRGQ